MSSGTNLIGKTIGQYTILEEIGRGGMATVYSAMQNSMNRKVAIKILPPHFMHDPGFLERFVREVEVISHLEHPHILPIYDYGQVDGVPFIAMRFLGGGSMAQMIRRGVIPLEAIDKPFSQVCQALDYAHQQGIIHRDLKPGNIMLDETGNAYLSDFGIARVMGSNLTGSAIIGTPAYMSPEQAHGMAIDARSDIYSMGVVLFELITGREPFQAETPMGLLLMHINEPLPPISDFREKVPETVQEVVETATAKNPDDRYSSAGEMARAFSAALRGEKLETRISAAARTKPRFDATLPPVKQPNQGGTLVPTVPISDATPAAATGPVTAGTSSITQTQPGRNPLAWVAVVAIVLILVVGGVVALSVINKPPVPDTNLTPAALLVPTPFRSAVTVSYEQSDFSYTISVPQPWLPVDRDFTDKSDVNRTMHLWQAKDNSAFATLAMTDMNQAAYIQRYYDGQEQLQLIDEATAPNGTVRRSYRLVSERGGFGPGQMDVFFIPNDTGLIVLELYASDAIAADSTTLATLQLVLDSLRVKAKAA